MSDDFIQILHNACYGGWLPSENARELYNLRKTHGFNKGIFLCDRHDPILLQIYEDLGDRFDDEHSKTRIKTIPKKYEKYYDICENDGLEWIKINYNKYNLDNLKNKIRELLKSTISNDEKINELQKIID